MQRRTALGLLLLPFFLAVPAQAAKAPSFRNDVLPVLTKAGCNSGACHGAASGKNGFKLTLRGYDPFTDYEVLTREALGRRVLLIAPAHSLMLLKPTLTIPHGGGKRFATDSAEYRILADWIASGAPAPSPADPLVEQLSVYPQQAVLKPGEEFQLTVAAHFSDGTERDVTRWVKFSSTNDGVATVDENGRVQTGGHGEAAISLWYSSKVSFARIIVPFPHVLDDALLANAPRFNYIDDLVLKKLDQLRIAPSGLCTDSEFIRRVYLDTAGILPAGEEVERFLQDRSPRKRQDLVERLLETPEFVDYWTYRWSDLLLVSSRKLQQNAMWAYYNWIRGSVAQNKPWDQFVRELVTARGSNLENGAGNYFILHKDPIEISENLSQAFLGLSLTCARCHNHPLEKWTQDQYYGAANLFARVSLKNGTEAGEVTVVSSVLGEVNHPRTGKPMPPQPLEGEPLSLNAAKDRRLHFAEWLTSPENPYFARAAVNRIWANFMGRGLVEPVDDLRATNPASNEELLAALTADFVQNNFDVKQLIRTILNSATYQLSSATHETNQGDDRYYSHYLVRRLPAEVILDAFSQVSRVPEPFQGFPPGTRALQLPDTRIESYFLTSFGRPERVTTCECERQDESNIAQALHIINGKTLNRKLRAQESWVGELLKRAQQPQTLVEEVYLSALSRRPSQKELSSLMPALQEPTRAGIEDFLWSVLTSKEFLFNH